ncbi:MAG: hypothetical protein NTV70_20230 [Acidobacteria bacterium]|nr:hypothetical protein [Acidobacteriota bacterium]
MVPLEEWKERTSLVFSRRGPTTLQVDAAYAIYYASRTEENADRLYFLLEKYLREHSGRWSSADRNLRSGGLMQAVYSLSRQHAHAGLGLAQFSTEKKQYGEELVSEVDALQFWKEQRQTIAQRFFENCSLDWKVGAKFALGLSAGIATTANAYNIADGALVVRKLVNQIAAKAVDPTVMAEVLQFIERSGMISEATREFAGSLTPASSTREVPTPLCWP